MSTNKERTIPLHAKGKTLLSGNIFCAHCGGRLTVSRYQDRYTRKDGTEYRVDQLKYTCYHKSRKLNDCDGQTSYIAETIDKAIIEVLDNLFKKIKEARGPRRSSRSPHAGSINHKYQFVILNTKK